MAKLKLKAKRSPKKVIIIACIFLLVAIVGALVIALAINDINSKEIVRISVISLPNKVDYYLDEDFEIDGLKVQVVCNNGDSFIVESNELLVEGFDSSNVNDSLSLKVKYQGFEDSFAVKIKAFPKPAPTLVAIDVKGIDKTTYTMAEWNSTWLIIDGAYIECQYSDGSTYRVTLTYHHIDGLGNINGLGTYELTVRYEENGVLCSKTLEIKITQ